MYIRTMRWWHVALIFSCVDCKTLYGIFENQEHIEIFNNIIFSQPSSIRKSSLLIADYNSTEDIYTEICNNIESTLFYVIGSTAVISYVESISYTLGYPVIAFDSSHNLPKVLYQPNIVYMNNVLYHEGALLAEIAEKNNLRYINALVQDNLQYDGLLDGFQDVYVKKYGRTMDTSIFSKDESPNNILIKLLQNLNSQAQIVGRDRAYFIFDVVLLHIQANLVAELIEGAQLLFFDRQIIWLIGSEGFPQKISNLKPGMVKLTHSEPDETLIRNSVQYIWETMDSSVQTVNEDNKWMRENRSCDMNNDPIPAWRWLQDSSLMSSGRFTYTNFELKLTVDSSTAELTAAKWISLGEISPINITSLPSILKPLSAENRQMYTIVTVIDKPFVTENYPSEIDGEMYCQTPAILCLKIPEQVIDKNPDQPDIVRNIFQDFYRGELVSNRTYEVSCCEGLSMDILQSLASELDFAFQLYIVPDGQFGAYDSSKERWSGMVREVLGGRCDMVMASFSITSPRAAVIDYSAPYYHSGFSMMSIKRENVEDNDYFGFLSPYPSLVWAMIFVALVIISVILALLEWFSPTGWNPLHKPSEPSYTLGTAIKTAFGQMFGNIIPTKAPRAGAARMVSAFWGFFSIIFLAGYTANLTAFIADKWSVTTVTGIYDPKLYELRVAAPKNSAAESFVKMINSRLFTHIKQQNFVGTDAAVAALRNDELDVFLHDTPVIEYLTSRENFDCTLTKLGTFAVDSYGAGFPKNNLVALKQAVSAKLLEYQESGYIEKLRRIYFPASPNCVNPVEGEDSEIALKLTQAAGLFMMLIAITILCFILIGIEHLNYKLLVPYLRKKPAASCCKSVFMLFVSQRLYRAITAKEPDVSVFKSFVQKISGLGKAISTKSLSFTMSERTKHQMTFYDVVAAAYQEAYHRPIESIMMRTKPPAQKRLAHATRVMALATTGFEDVLSQERQYSDKLDFDLAEYKFNHGNKPPSNGAQKSNGTHSNGVGCHSDPAVSMNDKCSPEPSLFSDAMCSNSQEETAFNSIVDIETNNKLLNSTNSTHELLDCDVIFDCGHSNGGFSGT